MQPLQTTNTSKPPTAHATGQVQLELGDEDSPDGADKPNSSGSNRRPTRPAAPPARSGVSQPVKATVVAESTNSSASAGSPPKAAGKATASLKRMFRSTSGDTTPRPGSATPRATGPATPAAADTASYMATAVAAAAATLHASAAPTTPTPGTVNGTTRVADSPPPPADKSTTTHHLTNGEANTAHPNHPGTGGAMSTRSHSTSVSPTSTLPTPPSEPSSSPPASRPSSRPGSRHSSFSGSTVARPGSVAGSEHANGGQGAATAAAQQHGRGSSFTLKDLLNAGGPKLARRTSQSSRKSDVSSERGGGGGWGAESTTTTSLLKKYGVCEKIAIGKGATSVVRLAHKWDRTEEKLYAVKEFRKRRKNESEKEYVKKLTAEFCISSTLHHVNIVETVDLVQDEAHHWCEVMEYCPGGDLYAAIKKGQMSPSEVECCFKQLLNGVAYLHSQGVAHRDIKPENLFFDTRGHLKIGDYGASTVYRLPWETTVHMSTGLCGSEPYIAPEQFLRKPYDARLVDVWAVGIVYYCLLFQELPWRVAQANDPHFATYQQACIAQPFKQSVAAARPLSPSNKQQPPPRSTTSSTSSLNAVTAFPPTINMVEPREARPLLRRILEPDPKLRANVQEILDNAWMKEIEVCTEVSRPRHQHSNIRAALGQPVAPLAAGGGGHSD